MAASHLIRLGTIKGKSGVLEALKHNKRMLQAERGASKHINVTRTPLNYSLFGNDTPEQIATNAKVQMLKAGIETPRRNGVMAVEVIFSLPVDRHQQDTKPFFVDCLKWLKNRFAGELLAFDIHLDESAPHAHAIILPLINGKMQGNKLMGGTGNLKRLINLFHADVACHYGLSRNETKRLTNEQKQTIESRVLWMLELDPVMKSKIWPCVRDLIHHDPIPFAQLLSIPLAYEKQNNSKSFVDYKRSKGKGSFIT